MNFKKWIPILIGAAQFTGRTPASVRQNEKIKIGVIAPFTGNLAAYGQYMKNSIELTVENYNEQGGILGRRIETVMYDDKGDAEEAKNAFEKLKNEDKVDAVIGGVIRSTALSIAPLSNTVFRICSTDLYQGKGLAQFAYDRLNARKSAVMCNMEDDYSSGLADAIKNTFVTNYRPINGVTGLISFDRRHNPHKVLYIFRIQQGSNLLIQKIRPQ